MDAIKRFEGYDPRAKWDIAQHTNGFGTRANYAGEIIDVAEADRRFVAEIAEAASLVDKFAPGLDDGTRAALTSLTFNAGTSWMRGQLGKLVTDGDFAGAKTIFLQYCKAGGETLPGLISRRIQEASWFSSDTTTNGPALPPRPDPVLTATYGSASTAVVAGTLGAENTRSTEPLRHVGGNFLTSNTVARLESGDRSSAVMDQVLFEVFELLSALPKFQSEPNDEARNQGSV